MQSTPLIKLSRHSDATEIAAMLQRALQADGISVRVKAKADRLKILLEASQVPNRQRFLPVVIRSLASIQLEDHKVYVYGRQRGSGTIAWVAPLNSSESNYVRVGSPAAAAMAASTASLGLASGASLVAKHDQTRLMEENLIGQLYGEISRRLAAEQISGLSTVSDIEIEGRDVLVTFETREALDSRALATLVRQAALTIDADVLKIARLYKRHPRTQRSLPIREILLDPADAPAPVPARRELELDEANFDSLESDSDMAKAAVLLQRSGLKQGIKVLRLGLLSLGGLSLGLALAGWVSPLVVGLVLGAALILWQVTSHLYCP